MVPLLRSLSRFAPCASHSVPLTPAATYESSKALGATACLSGRAHFSSGSGTTSNDPQQRPASGAAQEGNSRTSDSSGSSSSYHDAQGGAADDQYGNDHADTDADAHDGQYNRDRALKRALRSSNAAELAAVHYFRGLQCGLRGRPDAAAFADQEVGAAEGLRALLPRYRVRPSLGQGPLSLACMALGAAAGLAPPRLRMAVSGAVGDALSEHFNEQLRLLNEAGAAAQAPDVRQALRGLRDLPRTPEGVPPAPDLLSLLQEGLAAASSSGGGGGGRPSVLSGVAGAVREWGVEGTVGAVVKAGTRVALEAAARL